MLTLYTIGFTKKSAAAFFGLLQSAGVRRLLDVRLNNTSQLAGFAKREDLAYFVRAICGIDYVEIPELRPTSEILNPYKKDKGDWETYAAQFVELMRVRRVEETVSREVLRDGCLLCSEHAPDYCHRRLAAEYLRDRWGDVEIRHLC